MNEVAEALEQLPEDQRVVHAPRYARECEHPQCKGAATHTIVVHFWPIDRPGVTRGVHNSVRMYPGLVACEKHAPDLAHYGQRVLDRVVGHVRELFTKLSLSDPDLKDCLIDVRTLDEALKMWSEPPAHSTLIVH